MRTPRVPAEEQYRLIMECRKSGLSDYQWCLNNDINPGTFYNWVKRLRNKGCEDIPVKKQVTTCGPHHQEVVKIEMDSRSVTDFTGTAPANSTVMELAVGNVKLRIPNGTDSLLLTQTIQIIAEYIC